jgi:hypothetical protein
MVRGAKLLTMCGMAKGDGKKKRQPGNDETLPSGSIRVRVYAGIDPVTNVARYLRATVPPGPDQKREVERVKAEFIAQVRAQRHPRTDATESFRWGVRSRSKVARSGLFPSPGA